MCSIKKPSVVVDANFPTTVPTSAFGAPDFCALLSKLKSTTASVAGKRADRREYNRKYFASERGKQVIRSYESRNRAKRNAYNTMRGALLSGKLVRPDRCEECGVQCRAEGHHDDYAQRLAVRWLCRLCHKAWHSQHGEALNG